MAFNGAFNHRGRGGSRGGYKGRNYDPNYANNTNNQTTHHHGHTNRGGHSSGFRQTFAAPADNNDYTKKRTFSQSEISFIKNITKSDKPKQQPPTSKKPKIDENTEDKPPVSFIFIGNLTQPFELTDAKNKQYLRAKLASAAPTMGRTRSIRTPWTCN